MSETTLAERMPLRILLAEDNSVNQQLALLLLGRLGYRADVAANGLETLEAVERQPYDVILMDVQMPEMDGLEASRQLCQRYPAERRPRIIAITANAMQGDREMCLAAGMDDYLSKPIRDEELAQALARSKPRGSLAATGQPPLPLGEGPRGYPGEGGLPYPAAEVAIIDPTTFGRLRAMLAKAPTDALAKLLKAFFGNAPTLLAEMRGGVERGATEEVRRAAHTLKSNAASFGALGLAELCRSLEAQARAGTLAGAAEQISQIEAGYDSAKRALIELASGGGAPPEAGRGPGL